MRIRRRSRSRRFGRVGILKWTGALATALVLVLWFAADSISTQWFHLHHRDGSCSAFTFTFRREAFVVGRIAHTPSHAAKSWPGCCRLDWGANSRVPSSVRLGGSPLNVVSRVSGPYWKRRFVFFRPWFLAAVIGFPTAYLIWFDWRPHIPPGHCRVCGYNLTGNESGVCSECATPVPKKGDTA